MKSSREVREAATLAERERIIKLLEAEIPPCSGHGGHYCGNVCEITEVIALIKGQQK